MSMRDTFLYIVTGMLFSSGLLFAQVDEPIKPTAVQILSEKEVGSLVDGLFASTEKSSSVDNKTVADTKVSLKQALKKYKITGFGSCFDVNVSCLYNNQTPSFYVAFKNSEGKIKTQQFHASITSIGLKVEFLLKYNLIFFTSSSVNYLHSMKTIELGKGIDLSYRISHIPGLGYEYRQYDFGRFDDVGHRVRAGRGAINANLTYVPFLNAPGGMLIVGVGIGFGYDFGNCGLSFVYGGFLKPVLNDDEKEAESGAEANVA